VVVLVETHYGLYSTATLTTAVTLAKHSNHLGCKPMVKSDRMLNEIDKQGIKLRGICMFVRVLGVDGAGARCRYKTALYAIIQISI
jgi:hypothetical protein